MRITSLERHAAVLSLAIAGLSGCNWGDRHSVPEELPVLRGLSVLEFDGVFVQLQRSSSEGGGLYLIVAGQVVEQAALRQGEQFVLTDGRGMYETYQLVLIDPERITLRRRKTFDRRASGEGIREVEDVVALSPYNLEKDE